MQRSQLSKSVTQSKVWPGTQLERPISVWCLPYSVRSGRRPFTGSTTMELRRPAPVISTQLPMPSLLDLVSAAAALRDFSMRSDTTLYSWSVSHTRLPMDTGRWMFRPPMASIGHMPRRSGSPQGVFLGV